MATPDIRELRIDYKEIRASELHEDTLIRNPFKLFEQWMKDAVDMKIEEPNAMCVSTCSKEGKPSSRMVLLRGFSDKGFVFFTNYESRKGKEILENPNVALNFWWGALMRQVRIEGVAEKTTAEESREYFQSRPRLSKIGAWASPQSSPLSGRKELDEKVKEIEEKFQGAEDIPLPSFWGGFRIVPHTIEVT